MRFSHLHTIVWDSPMIWKPSVFKDHKQNIIAYLKVSRIRMLKQGTIIKIIQMVMFDRWMEGNHCTWYFYWY